MILSGSGKRVFGRLLFKKIRTEGNTLPKRIISSVEWPSREPKVAKTTTQEPLTASTGSSSTHHFLTTVEFQDLAEISDESKRAISDVLKYKCLTKVQDATFSTAMSGVDVVAKAKTGTGKTVAFLLPIVERLTKMNMGRSIGSLILSPTRELAIQIAKEAEQLTTFHSLDISYCIGGTKIDKERRMFETKTNIGILVATPGRLLDHLQKNHGDLQNRMGGLKTLVLDEGDQLLGMGFKPALDAIMSYLPSNRQTLLYSATFPKAVKDMAKEALQPSRVFIDTIEEGEQQTNHQIVQESMICSLETVTSTLEQILQDHMKEEEAYKVLVFFNTARSAGFMAGLFKAARYNVLEIHSRISQSARDKASKQFSEGNRIMMFTSDVSARGVDYPDVSLVVQVGFSDREQYIHRVGRTGRAGKLGRGLLLLCEFEKPFLTELKDLDIRMIQQPSSPKDGKTTVLLQNELTKDLEERAEKCVRAFLGFYNSHTKRLSMNKRAIVDVANRYSATIGLKDPPSFQKSALQKMGLLNTPGLRITQ